MGKTIVYRKATRDRLIELLERIGYKVTNQSTDGTWKLIRTPESTPTDYWVFSDRLEHKLDDSRGGMYFYYSDCVFELMDSETVCVRGKNAKSLFVMFHNFKSHQTKPNEAEVK